MKRNKRTLKRNEQGITLIALVITIIVLLILAGVSIAMLTGENGILTQAQIAKEKTENSQVDEKNILTDYEDYINNATRDTAVVGEIVTGGNKQYSNNGTAIIPEGFAIVPELDNVEGGLVISDKENDINDEGNQFVWVPVTNFSEFVRVHFGTEKQKWWTGDFVTNKASLNNMYEPAANGITNGTEVEKMYKSVKDNKGFYIGRYESGNDGLGNAVSKRNVSVYNNMKWGNSVSDDTGGAVEKARNFDTQSGHTNITSTLIYGVQWDAVMRWISKDDNLKGYLIDSSGIGNYSGTLNGITGTNDSYQMKNIYDLAGNVWEWTMESFSEDAKLNRGGNYEVEPTVNPVSYRNSYYPNYSDDSYGFRIAFFL